MTKKAFIKRINSILILTLSMIIFCSTFVHATDYPELYCKNAIIVDNDSGKILYQSGENDRVYPASTTKVLTAILVLENLDTNSSTVVTDTAIKLPYGSSNAALKQGEVMNIKDLLYALMLKSGNDAANVLAEAVSGDIESFVVLMNEKLKELNCLDSHFTNAHGYHDDNHYTTPSDMMKILSYAIENEEFVEIFSTPSYTIEATNKTNTKREYQNTNRLILTKDDSYLSRYYEYCIGGKTGYTEEAGRTLLAYGKKDNKNLILGVFNSNPSGSEDLRYTDAINLFEYGFNNFEKTELINKQDYSFSYSDKDRKLIYTYSMPEDVFVLSNSDELAEPPNISYKVNLDYDKLKQYDITSQDYINQVVGTISITFRQNSSLYDKDFKLVLTDISEMPLTITEIISNTFMYIFIGIIVIVFLIILFKIFAKSSRKKKRKINKRASYSSDDLPKRKNPAYKPRRTLK